MIIALLFPAVNEKNRILQLCVISTVFLSAQSLRSQFAAQSLRSQFAAQSLRSQFAAQSLRSQFAEIDKQIFNYTPRVQKLFPKLTTQKFWSSFFKSLQGAGVRVSSGDLCAAEAPTEPTGETSVPARSPQRAKHFISQPAETICQNK